MSEEFGKRIVNVLIQARQFIAGTIEEVGGCDHAVNICCCYETGIIRRIDEELVKEFGSDVPWKFYNAEPTRYGRAELTTLDAAKAWARDGAKAATQFYATQVEDTLDTILNDEAPF